MTKLLKIYQNIEGSLAYLLSNNCDEKKFLQKIFKKKKVTILDLGCNLGSYLDLIKNNLKIKKIYAFEPSKSCYEFLKKKYISEKFNFFNLALSNKKKVARFYEKEITSQSTLKNNKKSIFKNLKNKSIYSINCISLDEFYKSNKKNETYDIIKIDCEGEDFNVLKGSKYLLKNKLVNLLKVEIEFNNDNFFDILNYLNFYNYRLVTITKVKFNFDQKIQHVDAYFIKK